MVEYLYLIPCGRLLFKTAVYRTCLALRTLELDKLVRVKLYDE